MGGRDRALEILEGVKSGGRGLLTEYEAKEVLRAYHIPTTREKLATNEEEAAAFADEIGYPVVLKICSPDITHKTDAGGVRVGMRTPGDVKAAYGEVVENAKKYRSDARVHGVLVQNMVAAGHEVIVGATRDLRFGPVLMFGLGGIFVEVLGDTSFRLAPVTRGEALEMMREVKAFPILEGYRGLRPADLNALADVIVKASGLVVDLPEIVEVDINPVFAHERGAVAVDARIVLSSP
ncbi:MAG: acetate--CoA ligase family protein [Candidatus Geothermarchaeales archaeon]